MFEEPTPEEEDEIIRSVAEHIFGTTWTWWLCCS
jgi:hypothetical protein